jgi:hypothetical protein
LQASALASAHLDIGNDVFAHETFLDAQPVLSRYIFNLTGTGFRFNSNRGRVHSPLILIAICEGPQATAGDNFRRESQAARMTAIESIEAHHQ